MKIIIINGKSVIILEGNKNQNIKVIGVKDFKKKHSKKRYKEVVDVRNEKPLCFLEGIFSDKGEKSLKFVPVYENTEISS